MDCVTAALDRTFTQQPHMAQDDPDRTTPRETWKGHRACFECRRHVNRDYIPPFFPCCFFLSGCTVVDPSADPLADAYYHLQKENKM